MVNKNYLDEVSNVNKLIHSKYISSSSNTKLKIRLFRILKHLTALQIGLVVSYKGNTSQVAQIALKCVFDKVDLKNRLAEDVSQVKNDFQYEKLL